MRIGLIGKVGGDEFGRLVLERLMCAGNIDGIRIAADESTSYTIALASSSLDRILLHYPGVNDSFCFADVDCDLLSRAKHFHFGYPPLMRRMYEDGGMELVRIFSYAKTCGLTTSLDMSLPDTTSASGRVSWMPILQDLLPYVDMFLPSVEEALYMVDPRGFLALRASTNGSALVDYLSPGDYTGIAKTMLSMGTKMVALKSAHRGFYFMSGDAQRMIGFDQSGVLDTENWTGREMWCPAYHVKSIATSTGAGDSSIAGFLSAFLKGCSLEKTLKVANYVGYRNLHAPDAVSSIEDWATTVSRVESDDMEMNDPHVDALGWRWDSVSKVMIGPADKSNL